jgi:hypothetical protein
VNWQVFLVFHEILVQGQDGQRMVDGNGADQKVGVGTLDALGTAGVE